MPNLLDNLFRKKLQERNFHPEAGDWAAMNELIDQSVGTGGLAKGIGGNGFSLNWLAIAVVSVSTALGIYFTVGYVQKDKDLSEKVKVESPQKTTSSEAKSFSSLEHKAIRTSNTSSSESVTSEDGHMNAQQYSIDKIPNSEVNLLPLNEQNENSIRLDEESLYKSNLTQQNIPTTTKLIGSNSASNAANTTNTHNSNPSVQKSEATELIYLQNMNETSNETIAYSNKSKANLNLTENKNSATLANNQPNAFNKNQAYNTYAYNSYSKSDFDAPQQGVESFSIPNELVLSSSTITSFKGTKLETIKPLSKDNSTVIKVQNKKPRRTLPLQLSLAAFGEISYITKNITGDMEYAALIRHRNNEEKNIITAGGGLEFQVKYKQFGLSSGFAISNWGENVQYEDQNTSSWDVSSTSESDTVWTEEIIFTYDSVLIDSMWIVFYDSSIVTVIDTILITTTYDSIEVETPLGLNAQNGRTTISYWEIPLYFSYQFDIGDFYITPGLGINIGFLKVTSGYYLNENIDGLIQINTGYAVMRKTLLSGQINLGVGYRLGDKFAIEATPIYRFNLGNVFEKGGIVQKYSSLSLQFKLRYYF